MHSMPGRKHKKVGMRNRYSRRNSCLLWRVCPAGTIFFSVYRISRFMKGWLKSWCRTITGIIWHIFIFMHMIIGRRWLQGPTVPRHLFYISVKGWHWQKRLEMSSWYMMHIRKTLCLHQRMVWMRLPCCIPCVHTSSWNQGMMFMRAEFCPASDIIWVPWEKTGLRSIIITVPLRCFTICVFRRILRKCFTTVHWIILCRRTMRRRNMICWWRWR